MHSFPHILSTNITIRDSYNLKLRRKSIFKELRNQFISNYRTTVIKLKKFEIKAFDICYFILQCLWRYAFLISPIFLRNHFTNIVNFIQSSIICEKTLKLFAEMNEVFVINISIQKYDIIFYPNNELFSWNTQSFYVLKQTTIAIYERHWISM